MESPKLSIITVNYKSFSDLSRCIAAIKKNEPQVSYEIIVIDNDSKQPEEEQKFLQEWGSQIIYIHSQANVGFGAGNDIGIKQAKGEYLLLVNPDVEIWENAVLEAVRFLDEHKEVGILGGQLRYPTGAIQDSYRSFPSLPDQFIKRIGFLRKQKSLRKRVSKYLMWDKDPSVTEPVDWVVGGFMFIRKKAYETVGGFDQRYFLFMEDVDLCRKMWEHGYAVYYHPKVSATHREERLSGGGIRDFFRKKTMRIHTASAIKYFWKYKFKPTPRRTK